MRCLLLGLLLLSVAGCSEPPQKEIDQAQSEIDAARTAGADVYAADEFAGATVTLQKARDAVGQRDYRQALSYALDARQRAQEAVRLVPEARAKAKAVADAAYASVNDRADRVDTLLREAVEAKVPARELHDPRETLAAARTSLQEARTLIDNGKFAEAAALLPKVRENLDLAARTISSIPPRPRVTKGRKR